MTGLAIYTLVHVLISLIGIGAGLIVLYGLLTSNRMDGWTAIFLLFTAATSLTGFFFPFHGVTPGIILGILSLIVLAAAAAARYGFHLAGAGRALYVCVAIAALYFNVFVFVVQAFQKIPALHVLAPKGSEPPFAIVQGLVLIFIIGSAILSLRKFYPAR
jgi:hypothetical protein